MFLYEDGVGWSGERFPPLDDIYRNNKRNIPRTGQNGLSFFHCVATAWLTLFVLTYWHLLKSSDYHQKKETLEWLSLVWGIPDIPMTNPEITPTNTDGNNLHDWQIHFLFDFPSNLWRRRDRLLPRYPWRARDQSWGVTSVGVPASNPQSSAWTLGQRLRDMFFPPSHATVPRPCPQEEDITMLGENPMQSFSLHDLQVFLSSLLITRAYFYNWGWQSCWGR